MGKTSFVIKNVWHGKMEIDKKRRPKLLNMNLATLKILSSTSNEIVSLAFWPTKVSV